MKGVIFKNKDYEKRFNHLVKEFFLSKDKKITEVQQSLIEIILIHYKKFSNDEYFLFLWLLYGLLFFWLIDIENENLTDLDRKYIKLLKKSYSYEILWEKDKYIESVLEMDENLFSLKMIIKYTVLSFEEKYIKIIPNNKNYIQSIWYIIPYLTLKKFKLLWFFQDKYFEKMYPEEYKKTKKYYYEEMNNIYLPSEHLVYVVNNLFDTMTSVWIIGKIKLRKKSLFSIYNKLIRKTNGKITDSIWIRIVFNTLDEIKNFVDIFEETYVFKKKKDYIFSPKKSWYRSIHYDFICPYQNKEVNVELQIRTVAIDEEIKNSKDMSHYIYTVKENKWADVFKEVKYWYKYLNKIRKKQT